MVRFHRIIRPAEPPRGIGQRYRKIRRLRVVFPSRRV
jgi:hypothetical protein